MALTLGILGGGQLARMLAQAGQRLGVRILVNAASLDEPAAQVATCEPSLERLLKEADVIAFENEFISRRELEAHALASGSRARFVPELAVIERLQDKITQKEILSELGIPSADFRVFNPGSKGDAELAAWIDEVRKAFPKGVVYKWAKYGYDGKGTLIRGPEAQGTETMEIAAFAGEAFKRGSRLFAEERVNFARELAIVCCHSTTGEFKAWPLVVSKQQQGICKLVTGPASALGASPELERHARTFGEKLARALPIHGVFAIELFETEGGLRVNELAPRVHNSGHFTMDASATSQFENHVRAVLGMPLGETASAPAFAMLNLLGPSTAPHREIPDVEAGIALHWYGKKESRPGRKLGHLNARSESPRDIAELVRRLEACENRWIIG